MESLSDAAGEGDNGDIFADALDLGFAKLEGWALEAQRQDVLVYNLPRS